MANGTTAAPELQQFCGGLGSKVCPIKKSLASAGGSLDLLIKCGRQGQACRRFTLKVTTVQMINWISELY
jgi:hypothetical protein